MDSLSDSRHRARRPVPTSSQGREREGQTARVASRADEGSRYTFVVATIPYALEPGEYLRAIDASRETVGKPGVKLLDIVDRVSELTGDAPYAVIGGLAQILWARKTHTDDLDVALAAEELTAAYRRVCGGARNWALPAPPDQAHEEDDVFEVYHLLYRGSVVDLIAFKDAAFTLEILDTARPAPELGGIRFIRPELLLVTHLLRPTVEAKLAAVELIVARRTRGDLDVAHARRWAEHLAVGASLERVLDLADRLGES